MNKPNILFVCGRNKWRSPTAVNVYKNDSRINVRSAGMSSKSNHTISGKDLEWADLAIVMESKYKSNIIVNYRDFQLPHVESLDIPDEYNFMDDELIEMIKRGTEYLLKHKFQI